MSNCIVCHTRPVNPNITSVENASGKSFCSRICEYLYFDVTLPAASPEFLRKMADRQHSQLVDELKYQK